MVKKIYSKAYSRFEELTGPYISVTDINFERLPTPKEFAGWDGNQIVNALVHDTSNSEFKGELRQFFHCFYKIAAEEGDVFIKLLIENRSQIEKRVTGLTCFYVILSLYLLETEITKELYSAERVKTSIHRNNGSGYK